MKKFEKILDHSPLIFIVIATLLFLLNYTKSKQMNHHIEAIVIILYLIALSIDLYNDIRSRKYSTYILIILADVAVIAFFIALFYFSYQKIDKENFELVWERADNISRCSLFLAIIPAIKGFLKSQRFEKNIQSDLPK